MREVACWLFCSSSSKALAAASRLAVVIVLAVGCGTQEVDQGPQDIEKARQDHIKIMQRESGKMPAPDANGTAQQ